MNVKHSKAVLLVNGGKPCFLPIFYYFNDDVGFFNLINFGARWLWFHASFRFDVRMKKKHK